MSHELTKALVTLMKPAATKPKSKRWTFEEDKFLHAYFPAVGDFVGTHDLGRPEGAATKRVAKLKETGAWQALTRMDQAIWDYRVAAGLRTEYDRPEDDA